MAGTDREHEEHQQTPVVGPALGVVLGLLTVKLLGGTVPLWALVPVVIVVVAGITWIGIQWSARRR
jgi:hypothetical protein